MTKKIKYIIFRTKESNNRERFKVMRLDGKPILKGVLGHYFDDMFNAKKYLKELESGKYFKDNNIKMKVKC